MGIFGAYVSCEIAPPGTDYCVYRINVSPWALWRMWFHEKFFCPAMYQRGLYEKEKILAAAENRPLRGHVFRQPKQPKQSR